MGNEALKPVEDLTFREAMAELDGIVGVLESNTLELEDSLASYERRGLRCCAPCRAAWQLRNRRSTCSWASLSRRCRTSSAIPCFRNAACRQSAARAPLAATCGVFCIYNECSKSFGKEAGR